MLECFSHHYGRCRPYREFCGKRARSAGEIPPIFVPVLKRYPLLSVDRSDVVLTLTSSGTSGEKTVLFLNGESLDNLTTIAERVYGGMGLVNKEERDNYLCFTYDPEHAKDIGTAWSDKNNMSFTRVNRAFYALKWRGKGFYFDREGAVECLRSYSEEGLPVRILGFPAYMAETLREFEERYGSIDLGERSFVLPGGGWKNKRGQMSKADFRRMIRETTGIPEENVRDCYGLAEHGVPYVECEFGNMHVPIYAEARAIDPRTMEERSEGLLHLMTPYNLTSPYMSVLTTDYGTVKSGCGCGRERPYIEIFGRAGVKKYAGCAISALQYL
jgi:hypothetical protein